MNSSLKVILSGRMLVLFLMGFSSGIPLLLIGSTLRAWMTEEKVDLTVIGIFSLVGLPYALKFLWAPLMDRYVPPFLGRRRGWMLITQIALMAVISVLGFSSPAQMPWRVAVLAFLVAFFSASQDIVVDAYRREVLTDEELGLGSSLGINGYRIALLTSGALALFLADHFPWKVVYLLMAGLILVGIVTTLSASEPRRNITPPGSLKEALVEPFLDYFKRKEALGILAFILLYKIGDQMASDMATPFYLKIGFTKTEIAAIAKTFGLGATISGALLGGILMLRLEINRSLWIFGFLQMISTFCFSLLAQAGPSKPMLAGVIAFENLSGGMGTTAYAAFMASLCNVRFTATQYALLSSLIGIPRVFASAPTGYLAKHLGWSQFFIVCGLAALPGLLLLSHFAPWKKKEPSVAPANF
jgi:PAT family beta-lactamase induction signal transducer AmpG